MSLTVTFLFLMSLRSQINSPITSDKPENDDKHSQLKQLLYEVNKCRQYIIKHWKYKNNLLLYLSIVLLTISNDIKVNPGPTGNCSRLDNNSTIYPCGTCDNPVTWDDKGIVCDTCNQWYHAHCQSMDTKYYLQHVENTGIAWDCITCGCPNYSTFCYPLVFSTSNHYSIL